MRAATGPSGRSRDVAHRAALAGAAFASLAFSPWGLERWALAKVAAWLLVALLAAFAAPQGSLPRWCRWWLAAAVATTVILALASQAPAAQLIGRWPKYEGLLTLGAYAVAAWAGARLLGRGDAAPGPRPVELFMRALAWATVALALVSVAEALGYRPLGGDAERPGALLGSASDQGIVGVVVLALFAPGTVRWAATPTSRRREPLEHPLGAAAALVAIAASASRAALVAAAIVLALHLAVAWRRGNRRRSIGSLAALGGLLALAVLALPMTRGRALGHSDLAQATVSNRFDLWRATRALVADLPLAGAGPNGFSDAVPAYLDDHWFATVGVGSWTESPHSLPLQVLAAGGLVGAGLVVVLGVLAVRHLVKRGQAGPFGVAGLIAIAGFLCGTATHSTSPGTTLLVAFIGGSLIAVPPRAKRAAFEWTTRAALAAGVVVLGLALIGDAMLNRAVGAIVSDPAQAREDFRLAQHLRPWDVDVPLMAAEAYAGAASAGYPVDLGDASMWAERAVRDLPNSPRAFKAQGVIALYGGNAEAAAPAFARATSLAPTDPQAFHLWGGALLATGNARDAVPALERAHALNPDNPDIVATLEYARSVLTR